MGRVLLKTFFAFILIIGIAEVPAFATHFADHRFTIYGYVHDEDGAPLVRVIVEIKDDMGLALGRVTTDTNGSYKKLFHFHNDSLGNKLTVSANNVDKDIIVRFDPDDRKTDRKAEVNFGPAARASKGSDRTVILGVVSLVVLIGGIYITLSGRKKKRMEMAKRKKRRSKKKKR
ncbi:MAG: carboxypeptidase-like regulatory domain-containing protein [Thermodesulfobacteriota bacterium]